MSVGRAFVYLARGSVLESAIKDTGILLQFLFLMEKSIPYVKIAVSE